MHAAAVPGLDDHDEEHENHERWLVTYADMITLLMVLFIVLYAIGQTDLAKFERLKDGLQSGFNGGPGAAVLQGGTGPLAGSAQLTSSAVGLDLVDPLGPKDEAAAASAAKADRAALAATRDQVATALAGSGLGSAVSLRIDERGLVVSIASDPMLFDPGQATLRPEGREILDRLAPALAALPNRMSIEGHTDDVPISGTYPSNWELSTARATTVLRVLAAGHSIAPARLSAAGYADQRPVSSNADAAGRAANRRVEIVVLAQTKGAS